MQGFTSAYEFVVTEWPRAKTISSFWRLVLHHDIDTVIVIGHSGLPAKVSQTELGNE